MNAFHFFSTFLKQKLEPIVNKSVNHSIEYGTTVLQLTTVFYQDRNVIKRNVMNFQWTPTYRRDEAEKFRNLTDKKERNYQYR